MFIVINIYFNSFRWPRKLIVYHGKKRRFIDFARNPPISKKRDFYIHFFDEMAYIDRTEEFKLAANAQVRTSAPSGTPMPTPSFSVSKFSRVTASLSTRVSKTTLKLQRLTDRIIHLSLVIF